MSHGKPDITIQYRLTEEELLECFLCLDSPKEGRSKHIHEVILTVLAIGAIILYALHPTAVHYMLLALLLVAALFAVHYYPSLRRRRCARVMSRQNQNAFYRISIWKSGWLKGESTPQLALNEKGNRLYEGPNIFSLLLGKAYRFCLPKRAFRKEEVEWLRDVLSTAGLIRVDLDHFSFKSGRP